MVTITNTTNIEVIAGEHRETQQERIERQIGALDLYDANLVREACAIPPLTETQLILLEKTLEQTEARLNERFGSYINPK